MKEKFIGIVDAYGPAGELLTKAFINRGFTCIHVTSSASALPEFRATFRAENFCNDVIHTGNIQETKTALAALGVTQFQPGIELGVPLAWSLNGVADVRCLYNKYYQCEAVRAAGLEAMRQALCGSSPEALVWATRNGLGEVVAKAPASAGTDGVLWCGNPLEHTLPSAFDAILGKVNKLGRINEAVLVQERLHGTEYVIDLVRCGNTTNVAALFKYTKGAANGSEFVYHAMDLLLLEEEGMFERLQYAKAVVDSILTREFNQTTAIHMEIIGNTLVECGFRLHGGQGALIGAECTNYGQVEMLVDAVADPALFCRQEQVRYAPVKYAKEVFLISRQSGKFLNFGRLNDLQALPSFKRFASKISSGAQLELTVDLLTCPGSVILVGADRGQIERDAIRIREIETEDFYITE